MDVTPLPAYFDYPLVAATWASALVLVVAAARTIASYVREERDAARARR